MLVLALDTTTRAGSIAVVRDALVLHEVAGDAAGTHAERLPGELYRALDAAGAALADVDLFAVIAGPGSFTGLRVGIATVQGLAMALGRPVVPVSALDALALAARDGVHPAAAWMDAQRGQVFAVLHDAGGTALSEATSLTPDETLEAWHALADLRRARFAGDGAVRYADALRGRLGADVTILPPPNLATIAARLAAATPARAVAPHAVVPIYVRRTDAEIARDRRTGR